MARKDPIAHLARHPSGAPPRLVREVLALGEPGIEVLLAAVADPTANEVLVANAAAVLGQAGRREAVPSLIARLEAASASPKVAAEAVQALAQFVGPDLVEPLLAAEVVGEARWQTAGLLARCGVRDPRIRERLEELMDAEPGMGASFVIAYGDRELAPVLLNRLERTLGDGEQGAEQALMDMLLLSMALEELGAGALLQETLRQMVQDALLDASEDWSGSQTPMLPSPRGIELAASRL